MNTQDVLQAIHSRHLGCVFVNPIYLVNVGMIFKDGLVL
jgi:hypothetical protein